MRTVIIKAHSMDEQQTLFLQKGIKYLSQASEIIGNKLGQSISDEIDKLFNVQPQNRNDYGKKE